MDRTLLDTDIFSEVLKAKNSRVVDRAAAYEAALGRFTISAITVMEIVRGIYRLQRTEALGHFLEGLALVEILSFDSETAKYAGRIYGELERVGQPIGRADPMIAATALQHGLTLATGNNGHFERICGLGYPLKLVDWRV
ncbi:MAG: PIN domain-containing protein [Candidatus Hydrogenedentes bacterium]|nr:PIN domain-containing protein [Candidatus Hydrogenedentota bacterium]